MITALKLRNFKKHEALDVTFTGGLNLITGPNWAGKTTVLSGVMFALGGATQVPGPAPQRRGTNTGFEVEMGFLVDGVAHRVSRKKTAANLYRGEELIASGTSPVNAKIEELLGMPMRRFRQLRYAEQKETHSLLTLGATELHKILDEITKAEDVTRAIEKLKLIITVEQSAFDAIAEEDIPAMKNQLAAAIQSRVGAEQVITSCEALLVEHARERAELSSFLSRARRRAEEFHTLERKRAALSAEIATLEVEERKRQSEVLALGEPPSEAGLARGETELEQLEKAEKAYDRALASAQHQQAELKRVLALKESADADVAPAKLDYEVAQRGWSEEESTALQQLYDDEDRLFRVAEGDVRVAKEALKSSVCGSCKRPFGEVEIDVLKEQLAAAEARVAAIRETMAGLGSELSAAARSRTTLKNAEAALTKATERAANATAEVARVRAAMTGPVEEQDFSQIPRLRRELTEARTRLRECTRASSGLQRLQNDLAEAMGRLKEAEAASDKLEHDDEALTTAEARERTLNAGLAQAEADLKVAKADLMRFIAEEELLADALAKAEFRQIRRGMAAARATAAKTLQKFLRDSRDRYAGQVWSHFMAAASDFASTCTDGQIDEIRRTEDGRFTYVEDGHEMQVKEASGAQAAIMGLSVQMALAESAGCPVDVLLIDEPTADMSPENSMATSAMLASLGKQIITISHSPYDSSVCSNQIVLGGE